MKAGASDWGNALIELALPAVLQPGTPVRFDCSDTTIAAAGRMLGFDAGVSGAKFVGQLREEKLLTDAAGMSQLASAKAKGVHLYICGLALTVWAASRMEADEAQSMAAYYTRLAEITGLPLRDSWPKIDGVESVVAGFADLARWMRDHERGCRGELDLPASPTHRIVGVPVSQSLIRAGDRRTLSQFFQKHRDALDAGWDPVRLINSSSVRHRLSQPFIDLLFSSKLRSQLAHAIQTAYSNWDGVVVAPDGSSTVPSELRLHIDPKGIIIDAKVPSINRPTTFMGPGGEAIEFYPETSTAIPLEWLDDVGDGGLVLRGDEANVQLFASDVIAFAPDELGFAHVPSPGDFSVWALSSDESLIDASPESCRIKGRGLPGDWHVLCDIRLPREELTPDLQSSPMGAVELVTTNGALRLGSSVWLSGHPPIAAFHLPDSMPAELDGEDFGYVDDGDTRALESTGEFLGSHRISVGDDGVDFEIARRGLRVGAGTIGWTEFGIDGFGEAQLNAAPTALCGASVAELTFNSGAESRLNVRIQRAIDVVTADGDVEHQAAPMEQGWLSQIGLPQPGLWTVGDRRRAVWLCVDTSPRQVIAIADLEVPATDAVCDLIEWIGDQARVVDRSGGGATARWERLQTRVRECG